MKAAAIIPARYGSTRFPGKPLAEIAGKTMIERVYRQTQKAVKPDRVLVATDDTRIASTVRDFAGEAVMTAGDHTSGTDRIAEVAADLEEEIIVNVQGDEPLIKPEMVDKAINLLQEDKKIKMSTLAAPMSQEDIQDENIVKVVRDLNNQALYFSRAPIPGGIKNNKQTEASNSPQILRHIGLYGFRRDFLLTFTDFAPTPLEKRESLEQLRALEHGFNIKLGITAHHGPGVDRPEDIKTVEKILSGRDNL